MPSPRALVLPLAALAAAFATPALVAQPAAQQAARAQAVQPGSYAVDPAHTLVNWKVDHFGISPYRGGFGNVTGTLNLDTANPSRSRVEVTIPIASSSVVSGDLNKHLMNADFFDATRHPQARFVSTSVVANRALRTARITGQLTLRGVTRPVTLDTRFYGSAVNPMNKKPSVGFVATTRIRRSDFGIRYGIPMVSDWVDLEIVGAFEKA